MSGKMILFYVGMASIFAAPAITYWLTQRASLVSLAIVAAAVFTIFARLGDVSELKLGFLQAKVRETINEANATIEQLREVTTATSHLALTDLMASNFLDGMSLSQKLDLHDEVIRQLEKISLSDEQKMRVDTDWRKGIGIIYHRIIRHAILDDESNEKSIRTEAAKKFQELVNFGEWEAPGPERIREFLEASEYAPPVHIVEWVDDYEHFLNNNKILRREKFAPRDG